MADVKRHSKFYFQDGNLVLKVEDVLFRVFKSVMVRHSAVFANVLNPVEISDVPNPECPEGLSDDKPFVLEGIKSMDFEALLCFIFPLELGPEPRRIYFTEEQCVGALELATRWEIRDVLPLVTEHLCRYDFASRPDTLLLLASTHNLKHRKIYLAVKEICRRETFFDTEMAERLGLETTVKIGKLQVPKTFSDKLFVELFGYDNLVQSQSP